jgi:FlaA1/EpsC-like NDP-sugar epimerase
VLLTNLPNYSILTLPRFVKRGIVLCIDIFACFFSVWLAFGFRLDQWGFLADQKLLVLALSIALAIPIFIYFGLYRAIFRYGTFLFFGTMARVFLCYSCPFFFLFSIIGFEGVPRSIGALQPILLFFSISARQYLMHIFLNMHKSNTKIFFRVKQFVLIYGAGSSGRQLAAALSINKEMIVKGFIDDDARLHGNTIDGIDVYSSLKLKELIFKLRITDVLLAIPSANSSRRNEIISRLSECGVCVRTVPGIFDIVSGKVRISDLQDLDMKDLLGRKAVPPDIDLLEKNIRYKTVLVTGAGGSIGSELCRQIIKYAPKSIILMDSSEYSLYLIDDELQKLNVKNETSIKLIACLASVKDKDLMLKIFSTHQPDTVFHAAAYKHVPLVEKNPAEGIRNNVLGTLNCAQASLETGVSHFILISTDKAVRPTNVMGASKRIAELVLQAMAHKVNRKGQKTKFSMVRFGNVLGSSGSVAPLFIKQIKAGGPITLTHLDITRYFMTIPEAVELVIQSSSMTVGGDVFVLDMGEPVRIYDLAVKIINLSGLMVKSVENPYGDIEIKVTGLRSGEKLYEELLIGNDPQPTSHPKIMKAHEEFLPWEELEIQLNELIQQLDGNDVVALKGVLKKLVSGYSPY